MNSFKKAAYLLFTLFHSSSKGQQNLKKSTI